jgi:type IV pilus assembly protein PilV
MKSLNPSLAPSGRVRSRRAQRGFALLENMVAVIVLSIGFIGAARLQTLALSMGTSSAGRQQAIYLVSAMEDRIRANHAGFLAGAYDSYTGTAPSDPGCISSGCTPQQMADTDYVNWLADIKAVWPSGATGYVCRSSTPTDTTSGSGNCDGVGNFLSVKVCWTEKKQTKMQTTGAICFSDPIQP